MKTKRNLEPWHRAYEKMQAHYTGQWSEITIQDFYDTWVSHELAVEKNQQQHAKRSKPVLHSQT